MPTMSKMNKSELYKLCKEQQETIKTLQFHNGCLEEEMDTFKQQTIQDAYKCHYDTWKKEQEDIVITELKEEIEKLKEILDDIELHPDYEDTIKSTIETAQKELKKEIVELNKKKSIKWSREYACPLIKKLQEENEKLKEANDTFTLGAKRTIESNCKLYKENQALKEEIKKLKEENNK